MSLFHRKPKEKFEIKRIDCTVAGVTFRNEDGTSRQAALRDAFKDNYDKDDYELDDDRVNAGGADFEPYEYDGKPAMYVVFEGKTVGNIPANMVDHVSKIINADDYYGNDMHIYDFVGDDGKKKYGATLEIMTKVKVE